ncbi:MAG: hypothetical protein H0U74_09010 [Bradymonadaceae bacterium]|nr:hypothetical protein [Lujinxingiaceae bacterium]
MSTQDENSGSETISTPSERRTVVLPESTMGSDMWEALAPTISPPPLGLEATPALAPPGKGLQGMASRWTQFFPAIKSEKSVGMGTFQGVYRPTILTILGVIMYLRQGWIVGEAGLLGMVAIISLTFLITGTTALSLSSITTNIRVGTGGVFSIISQSLGLETGGSIGIPLFLGQALAAALYIYGFSEAWLYIFPGHPQWLVAYGAFALAFGVTLVSTRLAFKLQSAMLVVILASFLSIILGWTSLGAGEVTLQNPTLLGSFEDGGFWLLFAVFFPAGTGITIGASMSGALANPRRSIPLGTLAAWATALFVYILMAIWYSTVATPEELRSNYLVVVDHAAFGELVLLGILGSTFTAALSSMVAAPRVLQALGAHGIVPKRAFFGRLSLGGEPRNAILATGALVAAALLLGSLNNIAILITMFFLLTYLTLNIVVLIEQGLGMISFRPIFRVPIAVPAVGTIACVVAIFVISPAFALVALAFVAAIYIYLVGRKLESPWQTVRSSIFVSLADWAAKRIAKSPDEANERSWKPDLLVPVESRAQLDGSFRFLRVLTEPKGSLQIVGVSSAPTGSAKVVDALDTVALSAVPDHATPVGLPAVDDLSVDSPTASPEAGELDERSEGALDTASEASEDKPRMRLSLPRPRKTHVTELGKPLSQTGPMASGKTSTSLPVIGNGLKTIHDVANDFQNEGLFASAVTIEAPSYLKGVQMSSAVMRGSFFRPNILFVNAHLYDRLTLQGLIDTAADHQLGVAFLYEHPESSLGHERRVNIWVRDQSPQWHLGLRLANLDLALLLGYQIYRNWQGPLRLLTVCPDPAEMANARTFLQQLIDDARLPSHSECWVEQGGLLNKISEAPRADLQILGLAPLVDVDWMRTVVQRSGSSCLFVRDSGRESALA